MVMFGPYTGQRLGDIAMHTWQNIDLEQSEIRLAARKTRKTLILPTAGALQRHLKTMPISDDPAAPLHPRAFGIVSAKGKSGHLSTQFADLLAKAGLREKKTHRKNADGKNGRGRGSSAGGLSFHCLRHTTVTLMQEAGIAAVVMELVGHDSEAMNRRYTHIGAEALRQAADSLPDVTPI
jgi:integrase